MTGARRFCAGEKSETGRPARAAGPAARFSRQGLLFQADGGVQPAGAGVVEPARGDGFGLGVEQHDLLVIRPQIAQLGRARAATQIGRASCRERV